MRTKIKITVTLRNTAKRAGMFCLLLTFLFTSCKRAAPDAERQEYITVGALFPLTGEFCDEGIRALNGLFLARKDINENGGILGKQLDIITLDDKGDPDYAVKQYNILKEKGVAAVIGSSYSNVTLELAKATEKDGMPLISPTASDPAVTKGRRNVFRVIFLDDYQAIILASFACKTLDAKTALVINGESRYGRISDIFTDAFKSRGGKVIAVERYSAPEDFDAILKKYRANQPDVIFCPTDYAVAAKLGEAAHRNGFDKTNLLGTDAWDGILSFVHDRNFLDRIYYTSPFAFDEYTPKVTRFSQSYFDNFSYTPVSPSALAYSSVQILAKSIENAGNTNAKDIITEMRTNVHDIITGQLQYDFNNNPMNPGTYVYIMQTKDGYYSSVEKVRVGGGGWRK